MQKISTIVSYGKWEIIEAATDYSNGWRQRSCTVRGETQESDVKHIVTLVPEVKATCGKPGTKAYYKCSECDQLFSDKDYIDLITDPGRKKYLQPPRKSTSMVTGKQSKSQQPQKRDSRSVPARSVDRRNQLIFRLKRFRQT